MKKERLDKLLVERALVPDLARAQALILAGKVCVGDHRRDKPGERFARDVALRITQKDEWASRGAYKLLSALEAFPELRLQIEGSRCVDIGASSGGFTDVLLRHGAASVAAVDVGYGQLVWRLQSDERVQVMDRTNVRYLDSEALGFVPEVATCDASFISLRLILPVVFRLLSPGGVFISLVKPQFEVSAEQVGEGGVVRDEALRQGVLSDVSRAAEGLGFVLRGAADSSIRGPKGNREILLVVDKPLR